MVGDPSAPTGVKILGWLFMIGGVLGIIGNIFSLAVVPGAIFDGLVGLVLSVAAVAGGHYMLKLRKLGWQLSIGFLALSLISSIARELVLGSLGMLVIPGIIISLLIIYYLWTKRGLFR